MSLILEALRKSEAERRRGQAPDLRIENPPTPARRAASAPTWVWWLFGGASLMACAWGARGLWTAADQADVSPPAVVTPAGTGIVAVADAPRSASAVLPSVTAVTATPADADVASTPAPQPVSVPDPPLSPPATAAMPPASPARVAPADAVPTTVAADTPPPTPAPIAAPPATRATAPPTLPSALVATATAASGADAPLRLTDLPTSERQQLPPLKISMHMWAQAPAQRFVIIDGARTAEGDRVGDAVVEEITADGVVLAWLGRRLKLSMR